MRWCLRACPNPDPNQAAQLSELLLLPPPDGTPPLKVRRPNGVEKQHLLRCRSCEVRVAYHSAVASPNGPRYLYVPPDAVSLSNRVAPVLAATAAIATAASTPALAAPTPTFAVALPPLPTDADVDVHSARHAKRARMDESVMLIEEGNQCSGGNSTVVSRGSAGGSAS